MKTISPLKWHGGKSYLAKRLVEMMPPHIHYAEPYFGGGSVLLAKEPVGVSEVVNDLNMRLVNFWRVLQDNSMFARFCRAVEAMPLSREEWEEAHNNPPTDMVGSAISFFVNCRQSLAGRGKCFTALTRTRTRRGMNGNVSEWLSAVAGLPAVHQRLIQVAVENRHALQFISAEDTNGTLFYCDPPYLNETRTSPDVYEFEMSDGAHRELLSTLRECASKVMLSGYRSKMYDEVLSDWNRHDFDMPNNAAGGKTKRRMTECVWCNF